MRGNTEKFGRIAQAFHWISMLLIVFAAFGGFMMVNVVQDEAQRAVMYPIHTTVGMIVSILTILRVIWAFIDTRPADPEGVEGSKALLFNGIHYALYILLFALAASGIGMLLQSGISLPEPNLTPDMIGDVTARNGHDIMSKLFMAMFVLHVAGVVRYQAMNGDTMGRMGISLPSGGSK